MNMQNSSFVNWTNTLENSSQLLFDTKLGSLECTCIGSVEGSHSKFSTTFLLFLILSLIFVNIQIRSFDYWTIG